MEDLLDVYQRAYDPLVPVVCLDETNKQLIKETRIPSEPGKAEKVDYEYERNGVAAVFMIFEPLAGKRETVVTETRNSIDFANVLKFISDEMYPHAEKIVLVEDNLNTPHFVGSGFHARPLTQFSHSFFDGAAWKPHPTDCLKMPFVSNLLQIKSPCLYSGAD